MIDQYGSDQTRIIQDLLRRIEKLEAGQRSGPGLQVGQASGPFLLAEGFPSGLPSSGGYVFVDSGGRLRCRTTTGDKIVPFQGLGVTNLGNLTSGDVSAPPDGLAYNQLRGDVFANRTKINDLLSSLRGGGSIS